MIKMLCFMFLLPYFGGFAIAAVPKVTTSELRPNSNGGLASVMVREGLLVQSLKTDLRDTILVQKLAKDTRKFDDFSETYSPSVRPLLAELRSVIVSCEDNLFDAIKPVYGWCGTAKDLLEAFTSLFDHQDNESAGAQNQIIESLFSEDISNAVSTELNKLSDNLNRASLTLVSISTQLDQDFSEQSTFFETALRDEFVKDKNKRYTPKLTRTAVKALMQIRSFPGKLATELATSTIGNQQECNPAAERHFGDQQNYEQVAEPSPTNQQGLQVPPTAQPSSTSTIDPKMYIQYKPSVMSKFGQTRNFFENFGRQLNEVIRHINDFKSKLAQNIQRDQTLNFSGYSAIVPLNAAQVNQMRRAAQTLISQCRSFNLSPLIN